MSIEKHNKKVILLLKQRPNQAFAAVLESIFPEVTNRKLKRQKCVYVSKKNIRKKAFNIFTRPKRA